jgi:hypothetical protein
MRVTALLLLALLFTATPFYLLNALVMPQLEQLEYTYSHADEIAQRAVQE